MSSSTAPRPEYPKLVPAFVHGYPDWSVPPSSSDGPSQARPPPCELPPHHPGLNNCWSTGFPAPCEFELQFSSRTQHRQAHPERRTTWLSPARLKAPVNRDTERAVQDRYGGEEQLEPGVKPSPWWSATSLAHSWRSLARPVTALNFNDKQRQRVARGRSLELAQQPRRERQHWSLVPGPVQPFVRAK